MKQTLIKNKGAIPFLLVAFLNAFTDLGHKIIIQNAIFKYYDGPTQVALTAIVNALILLPFIMTFTPAGFLSDKFPKNRVIFFSSAVAIPITIFITLSYGIGAFWLAFGLTFILSLQSAIYSPAKYGYIKELVGKEKLAEGNAAVQAVTIVAILAGIVTYSVFFERLLPENFNSMGQILTAVQPLGYLLILGVLLETGLSFLLPQKRKTDTSTRFDTTKYKKGVYLLNNLKIIWQSPVIQLSIVGLGIFWAINQVIVASFPAFFKSVTGETNTVISQGIMAMSGIGIIFGAIIAGRVSRNYIETGLIPLGVLGLAGTLFTIPQTENQWVMGALWFIYGICGGLFIVPLNALIQFHAGEKEAGKVLAGNNFIQNVFMLIFLAASIFLAHLQISPKTILLGLSCIAAAGALYTFFKLPQSLIRYAIRFLLSQRYKLQVIGMKNIPAKGGVLLLGNHISFLDWAILQMACPRSIRFVMHRSYYQKGMLKWLLKMFKVIPITSGASKNALKQIRESLLQGDVIALFPEGHISYNGHVSKFKSGFEKAAQETGAAIIPFFMHGLWGSRFSRASETMQQITRAANARHLTVSFGTPLSNNVSAERAKQAVLETSIHAWKSYTESLGTIPEEWLSTAKRKLRTHCLHDANGTSLTGAKLLAAVLAFTRKLCIGLRNQHNIGILLPPSAGGVIANLSVLFQGKTVVNLNYTAEPKTLNRCAETAGIQTILTSKLFLKKLEERGLEMAVLTNQRQVIFLEDVKARLGKAAMLWYFLQARFFPTRLLKSLHLGRVNTSDTAAILFSSGSEGTPKGVQLTHTNILGNLKQTSSVINPTDKDVMMCSLPLFHAFGLTVTTFLPLIEGLPMVCQPDPTDARAVSRLVASYKVSILCATSTFLRIYGRHKKVHPLTFYSLRLIVAGAERLREDVRRDIKEKFGKDVIEGYGTTETTPVAGVNIPDVLMSDTGEIQVGNKKGTVGLPLPGTQYRIVDPDTLAPLSPNQPGLILIGGTQIMKGYLNNDAKTKEVIVEQNGVRWYKSGDRGKIDEDGFLTILDRYSRFAKIGGEMISLSVVEAKVQALFPDVEDIDILAVNLPDASKGEKIALLFSGQLDEEMIRQAIAQSDIPAIMRPREIAEIDEIPKLGTGKVDFATAKSRMKELLKMTPTI